VSEAWQLLAHAGTLDPQGRRGTFVRSARPGGPRRYRRVTAGPGQFEFDLSPGTPDPDLLPDLRPVIARVGAQRLTASYLDDPVLPGLAEILRSLWPFPPEALTVVDGALDALDRLIAETVRLGDRVLVENPTFPLLLDLLERAGADVIGLPMDEQGVVPQALAEALALEPVALFVQPRAQNPAGVGLTATRSRRLAQLLRPTEVLVVEDDHAGDIASAPLASLGRHLPSQTVHIRSFSKSHGPDLRLAAVGGAAEPILRLQERRLLGAGWSSRLLQAVLLELLDDANAIASIAEAREVYAERRRAVTAALGQRGIGWTGNDGINLWVEVHDEQAALVSLAARGVGAAPGSPFEVTPLVGDHLRVTVGLVPTTSAAEVADRLAAAAAAGRGRRARAV
jgi:DNA-binding transcriptional MocR family regulator